MKHMESFAWNFALTNDIDTQINELRELDLPNDTGETSSARTVMDFDNE